MRERVRTTAVLMVLGVVMLGVSGCAASETSVGYTTKKATISSGETLVVDFGEINSSVGDGWVIVEEPDPAVLGAGEAESEYLGEEGSVGGPSTFSYRFPAVGVGETVIEFEYQFRGEVPEDPADQKSSQITVTVE